jgi:cytoskeletal protein CcmA (bactofilin family)
MFKSRKAKNRDANRKFSPSIIAGDMDILGNLISEGTVDIEGRVQGNVRADKVIVRKDGSVMGDVNGEVVHIYGQVRGLVKARDVHLYNSCRVEGTIMHEILSIEDGAFVDGKFKRTDKTAAMERSRFDQLSTAEEDEGEAEPAMSLLQNIRLISSKE